MAIGAIMGQQKANPQLSNLSNNQVALYNIGAGTRPNLLDNWYFVGGGGQGQLPINQRGENFYTADGAYTIDRWKLLSPSQSLTLSVQSSGINLHKTLQRGDTGFYQVLGNQDNVGKTVTVSILYSGTGLSNVSLDSPGLTNGNIFQDSTAMALTFATYELGTGSVGTISNSAYLGIKLGSSMSTFNTLTVYAIKLEIGETQTLAYQDSAGVWNLLSQPESDYLTQLLKCQQYFYQINVDNIYDIVFNGITSAVSRDVIVYVPFLENFKGTPTVSFNGGVIIRTAQGYSSDATFASPYTTPVISVYKFTLVIKKTDNSNWNIPGGFNNAVVAVTFGSGTVLSFSSEL